MDWKKRGAVAAAALMLTLALSGCGSIEDKYASQVNTFNESLTKVETTYKGKKLSQANMETALREGVKATYKLMAFEKKNKQEVDQLMSQLNREKQAYGMSALQGVFDEIDGNLDGALGNSVNKKKMNEAKQKQEEFKKWQKEHEALFNANNRAQETLKQYYYLFPSQMRAHKLIENGVNRVGNAHNWDPDVNIDKLSFQEIFGAKSIKQLLAKNRQ